MRLYNALLVSALLFTIGGCVNRTRNLEIDGMYVTDTGTLAIGSVDVMAAPIGENAAMIRYAEDTAWLSPSTKTHEIKILLTGTNAVERMPAIVSDICRAFASVHNITSNMTTNVTD